MTASEVVAANAIRAATREATSRFVSIDWSEWHPTEAIVAKAISRVLMRMDVAFPRDKMGVPSMGMLLCGRHTFLRFFAAWLSADGGRGGHIGMKVRRMIFSDYGRKRRNSTR